jgi:hypothetical protein
VQLEVTDCTGHVAPRSQAEQRAATAFCLLRRLSNNSKSFASRETTVWKTPNSWHWSTAGCTQAAYRPRLPCQTACLTVVERGHFNRGHRDRRRDAPRGGRLQTDSRLQHSRYGISPPLSWNCAAIGSLMFLLAVVAASNAPADRFRASVADVAR